MGIRWGVGYPVWVRLHNRLVYPPMPRILFASLLVVLLLAAPRLIAPAQAQARAKAVPMECPVGMVAPDDADSPADVLDKPARAWSFDRWVRTKPLTQRQLRGKVVLVRWWTHGCHYCKSTLPEIEALRTRYADQGLVVIGAFHPKPQRPVLDAWVESVADSLGFKGPIAIDERWSTLERWWLGGHPDRNWTSVSFLIDRRGIVRWAHTGGEYHESDDPRHRTCALEAHELEKQIRAALAEPVASR